MSKNTKHLINLRSTTGTTSPKYRYETLDNVKYIVVPTVMLVEGVHEGNQGPGLYTNEFLAVAPQAWDHKPVVIDHPEIEGEGVSACSPDILEAQRIGLLMHTATGEKGGLTTEVWLDYNKTLKLEKTIIERIEAGEPIEVSTGGWFRKKYTQGIFNNTAYTWIAEAVVPDHLAILPTSIGACSVGKGCGCGVTNCANCGGETLTLEKLKTHSQLYNYLVSLQKYLSLEGIPVSNEQIDSTLINDPRPWAKRAPKPLTHNSMSFGKITSNLRSLLDQKFGTPTSYGGQEWYGWLEAVYENFCIYYVDGKLYKQNYLATNTEVSLVDDPSEVVQVTEYRTLDGAFVGNVTRASSDERKCTVDRKAKIDELVNKYGWKAEERTWLDTLSDERLNNIHNQATTNAKNKQERDEFEAAIKNAAKPAAPPSNDPPATPPATPPASGVVTLSKESIDALKSAISNDLIPDDLKSALNSLAAQGKQRREQLIKVILGNKANRFTEAYLKDKDRKMDELEGLASLAGGIPHGAGVLRQDYSGAAGGTVLSNTAENAPKPRALETPKLSFNREGRRSAKKSTGAKKRNAS